MSSTPTCRHFARPSSRARPHRSCAPTTASTGNRPAPTNSCCRISCAANGISRATWSRTAKRSSIFSAITTSRATQAEASALALKRGMDNECVDFAKVPDDHDYRPYLDAYRQGVLKESEIDTALVRLFTARIRLGMFDPPELVPYSKIDERELDSSAASRPGAQTGERVDGAAEERRHAAVARRRHQASPSSAHWPTRPATCSATTTARRRHVVSVLEGLKAEFPAAQITFVPGTKFLRDEGTPVPASALTNADGQPGLQRAILSRRRVRTRSDAAGHATGRRLST